MARACPRPAGTSRLWSTSPRHSAPHPMQRPTRLLLLLALLLGSAVAAQAQEGASDKMGELEGGNPLLSSEGSVSERVTKFYELYLPDKVPALKKIFFRYKAAGGDDQLLADLKSKYGSKTRSQIQAENREKERAARMDRLAESLRQAKIENGDLTEDGEELPGGEDDEPPIEEGDLEQEDVDPEAEEGYDPDDEGDEAEDEEPEPENDAWWGDAEPVTEYSEGTNQSDLDRMMDDFYAYVDHVAMEYGMSDEALVGLDGAEKKPAVEQRTLRIQKFKEGAQELYPDYNFDTAAGENSDEEMPSDDADKFMHHLNELFYG